MPDSFYFKYGKRILDIILSLPALIVLAPLFLIIAICIKIDDGGAVFYIQKRVGQNFKIINFIKFRTMIENAEKQGLQVTRAQDPRITRVGNVLRRYKLDELPQFINVARGDISVVGPRPEVETYVNMFREEYNDILNIKPGITDYAALYFRDEEKILNSYTDTHKAYIEKILPEKIELYRKYIKKMSFRTDLKIIAGTVRSMIG
jgi:lipopolysaccharide/colanic/teichoic acid biosynthesis glycosyltransferase